LLSLFSAKAQLLTKKTLDLELAQGDNLTV